MHLFHFSEESNIEVFHPRVKSNRQDMPPVVWAIDEEHAYTFYFPRQCPRIVVTRGEGISTEDEERFFGLSKADKIITVETGWYNRIASGTIYRYTLPRESFQVFDATAGYHISEASIVPIAMTPMTNLIDQLIELHVEVRFTPNLHPLYDAIVGSSFKHFGIHRFENASK
ncbi:hypothetical protein NV379_17100 [Paenibacillus sp. N1-5-1-14]|uniref:DUF6886 family protein n=1 Tax=Paenibacillus radicibacter TaxID=2972488 RepID=UPI0021590E32|nr:DUF6886 family protein [Paenibacillus radicibacter]MCR8644373.1 hypothetical protein [Paenibacillus radicibacter]